MTKTASPVWSRAECDGLLQVHHAEQSGKRTGSCEMKCGAGRQKMRREFWIHKVRGIAHGQNGRRRGVRVPNLSDREV